AQAGVAHQPENSRGLQNRMIGLARRVSQRCLNVIPFKIWKVFHDLLWGHVFSQYSENVRHPYAHSANGRSPAAFAPLKGDAFRKFHLTKMPKNSAKARRPLHPSEPSMPSPVLLQCLNQLRLPKVRPKGWCYNQFGI